jgi:hypothetical protein
MLLKFVLPFAVACLVFVAGCTDAAHPVAVAPVSPAPAAAADDHSDHQTDNAPRITLADAKKAFDAGEAIFVDSRAEAAYKVEHIKGAINISGDILEAHLKELPKEGKKIIAYCS